MFTSVPDKKVVFKGKTTDVGNGQLFDMTSSIVYPMPEGTALITFEEEEGEFVTNHRWVCVTSLQPRYKLIDLLLLKVENI